MLGFGIRTWKRISEVPLSAVLQQFWLGLLKEELVSLAIFVCT